MSETVYIATHGKCYHLETDCVGLEGSETLQTWERDMAEAWDKDICAYCADEWTPGDKGEMKLP